MPLYRLRYRVDTSLTSDSDFDLKTDQFTIKFLFSDRARDSRSIGAVLDIEAPNHNEAALVASGVALPPALDALSLATGSPSLLRECELILKREPGSSTRRGRYVGQRTAPNLLNMTEGSRELSQRLLNAQPRPELPMLWCRYAEHRQLILDRFVFAWLALEELAGDADIPTRCPKCGAEATHRGPNKERAWEIFSAHNAQADRKRFDREIWGKARNAVFHGSKYPDPQFLSELRGYTEQIVPAVGHEIGRHLNFEYRKPVPMEQVYNVNLFFEWQTNTPVAEFAEDWPREELQQLVQGAEPGKVGFRPVNRLNLLNYAENQDW